MKKRLPALFVALLIMITTTMPVFAAKDITADTVEISCRVYKNAETFSTYSTKSEAKANPIIYYVSEFDFPVTVRISAYDGKYEKYEFYSYGIQNVEHWYSLFMGYAETYAQINIKPYPQKTTNTPTKPQPITNPTSKPELVQEDTATEKDSAVMVPYFATVSGHLLELLEEPTLELLYTPESIYGQELEQYKANKWSEDGAGIRVDVIASDGVTYTVTRSIYSREYHWRKTNWSTGQKQEINIPIDYNGPLEIEPCSLEKDNHSLVIDHQHSIVEQWSYLEKLDSWQLPFSGQEETINFVGAYAIDNYRGTITTVDQDGQSHLYSLEAGGVVNKLY